MRRANKAERKLNKLLDKYPELHKKDTVEAEVNYLKPKTEIKFTFTKFEPDTMFIQNKDAKVYIWQRNDTIFGKVICDTIRITETVQIPIQTVQPTKYLPMPLKWHQKALMWMGGFSFLILIILLILRFIERKLNQF